MGNPIRPNKTGKHSMVSEFIALQRSRRVTAPSKLVFQRGRRERGVAEQYWYLLAMGVWYLTATGALLGLRYLPLLREPATDGFPAQGVQMKASERRQLSRVSLR